MSRAGTGCSIPVTFVPLAGSPLEAFLVATGVVALGEIGNKTQLLSLLLATKFRRSVPIIAGIFVATVVNHAFAGAIGRRVAAALGTGVLRWVVGLSFLTMTIWTFVPDQFDNASAGTTQRLGVFGTTVLTFFFAKMGDKTQFATIALAARYQNLPLVVAGTTLGMLLVDVPAVLLGETLARKVPMRLVQGAAALIFALIGVAALLRIEPRL